MALPVAPGVDPRAYGRLLSRTLPGPIRSPEQHAAALALVEGMMCRERTPEEGALFHVLVAMIEEYEAPMARSLGVGDSPIWELLDFLRERNGLSVPKLAATLGVSKATMEGVLSGRRAISRPLARKASALFGLPAEAFLDGAKVPRAA